jgi:hypothetical protein
MDTLSCVVATFLKQYIMLEEHDCNKMLPSATVQVSSSFYEVLYWEIINFGPLITWPTICSLSYPPPPSSMLYK